ncbi:hypothetical protein D5086_014281 [Populus alba]|uniref:Uncharacterized protein n=1 Tax=Populus alba TaxID=43335 RepID=A0ACC4BX78_POPAL
MLDYVNKLALALDLGLVSRMTPGSFAKGGNIGGMKNGGIILENSGLPHCVSKLTPFVAAEEMDTKMEGDDGNVESYQALRASRRGSIQKRKLVFGDGDLKITVKARYREDIIRFKFDPSAAGCFQLYEEVSKRFKLQTETFQLKYLDDEEEWCEVPCPVVTRLLLWEAQTASNCFFDGKLLTTWLNNPPLKPWESKAGWSFSELPFKKETIAASAGSTSGPFWRLSWNCEAWRKICSKAQECSWFHAYGGRLYGNNMYRGGYSWTFMGSGCMAVVECTIVVLEAQWVVMEWAWGGAFGASRP